MSKQLSDESSSDESTPPAPAKRTRTDTYDYGASSTTSFSSVLQESEDEQNIENNMKHKEENSDLLSQGSSTDEQDDNYKIGFGNPKSESDNEDRNNYTNSDNGTHYASETQIKENDDNDTMKSEYSDKVKKMMSKMGFKAGKGLGKYEHGRIEPVEASNQKGRRGLGLKPSAVGEIPKDFQWGADDMTPEAKEHVTWIPASPREPLGGDILEDWLKKGPKKLTIEDEIDFVDANLLKDVLNAKTIFDSLDDEDLRNARFRSNPYETIGAVIFLNRAAVKMANLDSIYDFMFTKPIKQNGESAIDKKEILYFADVCAGPGGFSEYVLYRRGWKAKGFGFTLKSSNDFKLSEFYAGTGDTFNPYYGVEGDGNIYNPANLISLKDNVLKNTDDKGVHFLMADGGFSVEGQENLQEVLSKQLYLCQCLAALMLVRTGGHFVVKFFDVFTHFSVGLIYIMYHCFEQVSIHKPVTSRPANSERYLVCKWKKYGTEATEKHLFSVNSFLWVERDRDHDIVELVPFSVIQEDTQFFQYIYKSNCLIAERQIKNLVKIAEFSKNKFLKESSQVEMRQQCLKEWHLPDKLRTEPERSSPDDSLVKILEMMKVKPPEAFSPLSFKSNILGKQAQCLNSAADLQLIRNVYDWHFVFLSAGRSGQDLKFFLGCGGKQVYQLDGIKWNNVVDLRITMPPKTLVYGEIVKEYSGQGNQQIYGKALHIIDAVMLGGIDVSHLPLSERINQCSLFCTALHKPFEKNVVPMRCKRLMNLEHFSTAVNNLEYRAMKRIKKAVTVTVPNRMNDEERFHIVGSLLLIKEIRDSWEARISKTSGHKYFFGIGFNKKPVSVYHIPEEASLDTVNAYLGRLLWPWEPASAVLENLPHDGLKRHEMEAYIVNNFNR